MRAAFPGASTVSIAESPAGHVGEHADSARFDDEDGARERPRAAWPPRERPAVAPSAGQASPELAELVAERVAARLAVRPLALSVGEACAALGVGWDFWRAHIEPELRVVRRGKRKLVPVSEFEAWLEREAERAL